MLYTSTAPLPMRYTMGYTTMRYTTMRYTTMGYTSMRYTSTALYFYKENRQPPNKFCKKHLSKKYVNKYFYIFYLKSSSVNNKI
jgi:hypothetical protein